MWRGGFLPSPTAGVTEALQLVKDPSGPVVVLIKPVSDDLMIGG